MFVIGKKEIKYGKAAAELDFLWYGKADEWLPLWQIQLWKVFSSIELKNSQRNNPLANCMPGRWHWEDFATTFDWQYRQAVFTVYSNMFWFNSFKKCKITSLNFIPSFWIYFKKVWNCVLINMLECADKENEMSTPFKTEEFDKKVWHHETPIMWN